LGAQRIVILLESPEDIALILNASEPIEGVNRFFAFAKSRGGLLTGGVMLDLRIPSIGIIQKGA
jgi:hypothetical protein